MHRAVTITLFAVALAGCSSGPAGKIKEPVMPIAQLSAEEARICGEEADVYLAFAQSRKNNVPKRQALSRQVKEKIVSGVDKDRKWELTNELYESVIVVYAIPEFSPATLYALKWSACKARILSNKEMKYGEILSVKEEAMRCQNDFTQNDNDKLRACLESVVGSHSVEMDQSQKGSKQLCRTAIYNNIGLHQKAIRLAKKGRKNQALDSLEKGLASWKKLASGEINCSGVERAIAVDGILRVDKDINTISRVF